MSELDPFMQGPEQMPEMNGPNPEIPPEAAAAEQMNTPEIPPAPETASDAMNEALMSTYTETRDRVATNPYPTEQELEIGVFTEEIQPQVRDAVLGMRAKGIDTGNVLHAGFSQDNPDEQSMTLNTPLSQTEMAILENNGFTVEDNRLSFTPEDPTNLGSIKETWDWLAGNMSNRSEPAPPCEFGNAVAFREAAEDGTLIGRYMAHGEFNMIGTKYVRELDPWADMELFLSEDIPSAIRELTLMDMYHEIKTRLDENPEPTEEELNMGAYEQEIEPQIRDAVMMMRRKGYNTGSSGFWGEDHVDQVMDVHTPIDDASKAKLAEHFVEVTDQSIRFRPENPGDMDSIKKLWDTVADILPDLGKHADPADNGGADMFRYIAKNGMYDKMLDDWLLQTGALSGHMPPLTMLLVREGRDFGADVYKAGRDATEWHFDIAKAASREKAGQVSVKEKPQPDNKPVDDEEEARMDEEYREIERRRREEEQQ